MNTEPDQEWVDLLKTAKRIQRSVRPVTPSPGFRRHLRSDLASALGTRRRASYGPMSGTPISPSLVLGLCLGLAAIGVALIALRGKQNRQR